jgi:hypothetical protein
MAFEGCFYAALYGTQTKIRESDAMTNVSGLATIVHCYENVDAFQ